MTTEKLRVINQKNKKSLFPLMMAGMNDNARIVRQLIQHGAEVNQVDVNGATTIAVAAYFGCAKVVEELLLWTPKKVESLTENYGEPKSTEEKMRVLDIDIPEKA